MPEFTYPSEPWLIVSAAQTAALLPPRPEPFNWDLLLKALGFVVTAIVAIVQIRGFHLSSRTSLKTDLEILKLMTPGDTAYEKVKDVVDRRLARVYRLGPAGERKTWTRVAIGGFGVLWAIGFAYWTFTLIRPQFSWWSLLTGYLSLAGLGWLIMAIRGLESRRSEPAPTN